MFKDIVQPKKRDLNFKKPFLEVSGKKRWVLFYVAFTTKKLEGALWCCATFTGSDTWSEITWKYLISNLTSSTCTFTVIQSFSQLYRHSHGLYNNLKALVNPYPKRKEKNAFRDRVDAFRVPESANREYKNLCRGRVITAHNNLSPFSLSFLPLCIRRGFDKNFAPHQ